MNRSPGVDICPSCGVGHEIVNLNMWREVGNRLGSSPLDSYWQRHDPTHSISETEGSRNAQEKILTRRQTSHERQARVRQRWFGGGSMPPDWGI
jgi:hypothetical protein